MLLCAMNQRHLHIFVEDGDGVNLDDGISVIFLTASLAEIQTEAEKAKCSKRREKVEHRLKEIEREHKAGVMVK